MFFPRALMRRRPPESSLADPAEEDLEKLSALREAGSKVELPHPVRFFLGFDSEADARAVADRLDREGHRGRVRAEPDGSWTVTVVETVVPSPGAITRLRETLTEAAEAQDGRFLDWTAPVVY